MKSILKGKEIRAVAACLTLFLATTTYSGYAQEDSTEAVVEKPDAPPKAKPVKNTFQSVWIIDNQTSMVPIKGTLEMDIMHRFGVINKGYKDLWGFFAPSNIRLGLSYAPINKLFVGFGITKANMLWDVNAKYSLFTQTPGKYPVSLTYYGNAAVDSRKDKEKNIFKHSSQRFTFFNQLIIARKINDKLSVQVAPSVSHQNSVNGYYTKFDSTGQEKFQEMKFDHFAVALSARYKVTNVTSIMINYDQPITKHNTNNPDPNLSFGVEFNTSSHSFQLFFGNYFLLNPQRNNLYNTNSPFAYDDPTKTHPERQNDDPATPKDESTRVRGGRFVIGFNITRLWNY
ncbi:MAG: hypothetical protein EOO01_00355 [Chitinophagaceae bacterium]|nr:MAG: hypothetical protein EOO01_00355 [Chitinophagaceae bacterium]